RDPRDFTQLTSGAFAQERDALQALDLLVLRHPGGGQDGLRQYPLEVLVRAHHPVHEVHRHSFMRARARTVFLEYPFSRRDTACIQPGTLTPIDGSPTVAAWGSRTCSCR